MSYQHSVVSIQTNQLLPYIFGTIMAEYQALIAECFLRLE